MPQREPLCPVNYARLYIRTALAALPLGTPRPRLDEAVEAALTPYRMAVAELQAQEEAQRQQHWAVVRAGQQRDQHAAN